jgi:hypothetical protein
VQQTTSPPQKKSPKNSRKFTKKRLTKNQSKKQVYETSNPDITRVNDYAKHLKKNSFFIPNFCPLFGG